MTTLNLYTLSHKKEKSYLKLYVRGVDDTSGSSSSNDMW